MSEKLKMKWKNFQENIISTFGKLRSHNDFSDVTLVCEDGHMIESHKLILASSSAFFRNIFASNKHGHPFIYLRGVKQEYLTCLLDFVYNGKVIINQNKLENFLSIGKDLKIEGIQGDNDTSTENIILNENNPSTQQEKNNQLKLSKFSSNTLSAKSFRKTANQQLYEKQLEKRCAANQCNLCRITCSSKKELTEHIVQEHQGKTNTNMPNTGEVSLVSLPSDLPQKNIVDTIPTDKAEKILRCKKCGIKFPKSLVKQHKCDNAIV